MCTNKKKKCLNEKKDKEQGLLGILKLENGNQTVNVIVNSGVRGNV